MQTITKITLGVLILILGAHFYVWLRFPNDCNPASQTAWSNLGQSFGGLSSLFSGLALCGVCGALYFQWEALKEQRQELKRSRAEGETTRLATRVEFAASEIARLQELLEKEDHGLLSTTAKLLVACPQDQITERIRYLASEAVNAEINGKPTANIELKRDVLQLREQFDVDREALLRRLRADEEQMLKSA